MCNNVCYYRNKELQQWLANKLIMRVFSSPYLPNLNLMERLWKNCARVLLTLFSIAPKMNPITR